MSKNAFYAYDPEEHRGWGPFFTEEEINHFIEHDKYLSSWCVVTTKRSNYRDCTWYLPEVYNENWAVGFYADPEAGD